MRRSIVAAVLLASAAAMAQEPAVPAPKCLPVPTYPGLQGLKSEADVKAFEARITAYKECIVSYIAERKAASKAHESAANAAADEHNKVMEKIRGDQEAARAGSDKPAGKK